MMVRNLLILQKGIPPKLLISVLVQRYMPMCFMGMITLMRLWEPFCTWLQNKQLDKDTANALICGHLEL